MKKRLLAGILAAVVLLSIAGVWYYTSYPVIGIGKMVASNSDKFEKEFHSELISLWGAGNDFLPDSPLQTRKWYEVSTWNEKVSFELMQYSIEGGIAYNIEVSGEIKDGKTTLRYEGYIITKDGERIDYKQEKTFDFVLCSEKRFF